MQLYQGRPADMTGRQDKEKRVYELLDRLGIAYERVDHEAAETMEACEEIDKFLAPAVICKNLFLCNTQKTKFYLLMIRGDKNLKQKRFHHRFTVQDFPLHRLKNGRIFRYSAGFGECPRTDE